LIEQQPVQVTYEILNYDVTAAVLTIRYSIPEFTEGHVFTISATDYGTKEFIPEAQLDAWIMSHCPRQQLLQSAKLKTAEHPDYLTRHALTTTSQPE
jgi:hypothetical protein